MLESVWTLSQSFSLGNNHTFTQKTCRGWCVSGWRGEKTAPVTSSKKAKLRKFSTKVFVTDTGPSECSMPVHATRCGLACLNTHNNDFLHSQRPLRYPDRNRAQCLIQAHVDRRYLPVNTFLLFIFLLSVSEQSTLARCAHVYQQQMWTRNKSIKSIPNPIAKKKEILNLYFYVKKRYCHFCR